MKQLTLAGMSPLKAFSSLSLRVALNSKGKPSSEYNKQVCLLRAPGRTGVRVRSCYLISLHFHSRCTSCSHRLHCCTFPAPHVGLTSTSSHAHYFCHLRQHDALLLAHHEPFGGSSGIGLGNNLPYSIKSYQKAFCCHKDSDYVKIQM